MAESTDDARSPSGELRARERRLSDTRGCLILMAVGFPAILALMILWRFAILPGTLFDTASMTESGEQTLGVFLGARKAYRDGRLNEARKHLDEILHRAPNHCEANRLLASICLHEGDKEGALRHLRVALSTSTDPGALREQIEDLEKMGPTPNPRMQSGAARPSEGEGRETE